MIDGLSAAAAFERELELAGKAREAADDSHALHHLVGAVSSAPLDSRWQAPLVEVLERMGTAQLEETTFWGGYAALAWFHQRQGRLGEAIQLLSQVVVFMPCVGLEVWLTDWVRRAHAAREPAACQPAQRALLPLRLFGVGRIQLLPGEVAAARRFAPLCDALLATLSEAPDDSLGLHLALSYRRAGLPEKTLEAVSFVRTPEAQAGVHVTRGLALRSLRRFAEAVAEFEAAYALKPDPTSLLEVMRTHADGGAWEHALAAGRRALRLLPEVGGEETQAELRFLESARETGLAAPTRPPLDDVRRRALGHGLVFSPEDATANILRQAARQEPPLKMRGSPLRLRVDPPEGPSARVCVALVVAGTSRPEDADYTAPAATSSEQAVLRAGPMALWTEVDGVPVQAVAPAPESLNRAIEELARTPQDFLELWDEVAAEPRGLGRSIPVSQWLSAMLHPQLPVDQVGAAPDWVTRWQTIAALGLAQSDSRWSDVGGKKDAFVSLMRGPDDWSKAVSLRAFTELALRDPEVTDLVREEAIRLVTHRPERGFRTCALTLVQSLMMLPLVPAEPLEQARNLHLEQQADVAPPPAPPAPEKPVAAKKWWRAWRGS